MWKCQSCKAWSSNSRSLCFGCGVSKEGQLLVREHVNARPDAGSNMTRQQSLSTPSMPVQTDTQEHVRGKKALKRHLQRSIDKLVAAKEQLPEEEGREVAQGVTDRIKALQLQKDGLMSVAARKKKAFAQLEESEKTLESKRKALQQAQEALEEATRKHAAAQEACASVEHEIEEEEDQDEEMHEEDQNNTRDPYRDWYNSSDCTSQSRELKEMRTAISQISDTLALLLKTLPPVAVEVGTTVKMPQTLALQTGARVEETASCEGLTESRVPATPKAASDGSRGGARSSWYNSSWKLCRRCYECTEPFSQHIRTAQTVLANKYAEHWCSLPESKEMVGEAEAPMSELSVGQLRNRVSSCVHLPMLFQLSPGAVSDMWCGALATDDDTVTCIEMFTDGSSLIPKAWPRVAASGGWVVSAICDNQCIAVTGMFFGEVTVDSGHPFFCGANNVQIGACEIQAILAALAWCHDVNLEAKSVTIRPDSMYAIGVLDRSHRCISHVQLVRATRHCLENARNKWRVNFKHTKAH